MSITTHSCNCEHPWRARGAAWRGGAPLIGAASGHEPSLGGAPARAVLHNAVKTQSLPEEEARGGGEPGTPGAGPGGCHIDRQAFPGACDSEGVGVKQDTVARVRVGEQARSVPRGEQEKLDARSVGCTPR